MQILLGAAGFVISLVLGTVLTRAARRQTAHFRSLVAASSDLVLVLGEGGCRYVSRAVTQMLGRREADFLADGFLQFVHPDDRVLVERAADGGGSPEIVFRLLNRLGEWRHVEAHVSDLRDDVHVRGTVLNGRDVSERVRLEAELASHAFRDGLTGLANRALARDRIDRALVRTATSGRPLALLVVDLVGVGAVNDEHGHEVGDDLLRQAAERLVEVLPASDTVARLDQDEFAILREEADEEIAIALARAVLDTLAQPILLAGREHTTGASVGIAVERDGSISGEDLLRQASAALEVARAGGRGRVELYTRGMGRVRSHTLGIEHELRVALERDELSVVYQPEIEIATGAPSGVEALVRWHTPERGAVAPSQFVPVAEAAGLIGALGHVVLRHACAQTAAWRRDGTVDDTFTTWVNVSGRQLAAGGLHALVAAVLDDTGLPPRMLGLEVTETALVAANASSRARGELEKLHADGVRLAIDDFGTGFSSLALLRTYPVDVLKVDRSFVAGVEDDGVDAALTANVISLAHALGLVAVGEGVESAGQLDALRTLGCDVAQGYLLARPARADVTGRLLRAPHGRGTWHAA
jgi:diguanylate cyclase (GGDEF)-like protein/PAS domain S-box-containing protein